MNINLCGLSKWCKSSKDSFYLEDMAKNATKSDARILKKNSNSFPVVKKC